MVQELFVKKLATPTKIPIARYVVNPYIGCEHGCLYCYARFIGPFKKMAGVWGKDIFVKVNAVEIFEREMPHLKGPILLSSVCDPYQPLEERYQLTRRILELINSHFKSAHILTKSSLVLRDIDLLIDSNVKVTITITTDDDRVRRILEPNASPIEERFEALSQLKRAGVDVSVFVGPILPMNPEKLARELSKYVDKVSIDGMNYTWQVERIYQKYGWARWLRKETMNAVANVFRNFLEVV
ncbi:SPL family radical SAM protein [Pseudothermotoga sp.]|nr:radical SAM protein [Pseudothermotoga sp.]MDW8139553.1 radical SAM protein [Pseudothermotoga sp.]